MASYIKQKGVGFYLSLFAVLSALVSLLAYRGAAGDMYGYNSTVGFVFLAAIAVGLVFTLKDFLSLGPVIAGVLYCAALGVLLNVRFVYFATVFTGIAQEGVSVPITVSVVFVLLAIVANILAAFFRNEKAA